MISKNTLYGLKNSCTEFSAHLEETIDTMGYNLNYAGPEVWIRPEVNPNGFEYHEYIL